MCIFGEMKNFFQWSDVEKYLSTADNQTKGELFEQITESYLKWSTKYQVILKQVWKLKQCSPPRFFRFFVYA